MGGGLFKYQDIRAKGGTTKAKTIDFQSVIRDAFLWVWVRYKDEEQGDFLFH